MAAKTPSMFRMLLAMAAFLILGAPLASILWHEFSSILYGRVGEVRWIWLAVSIPLFAVLLKVLSAYVRRSLGHEEGVA